MSPGSLHRRSQPVPRQATPVDGPADTATEGAAAAVAVDAAPVVDRASAVGRAPAVEGTAPVDKASAGQKPPAGRFWTAVADRAGQLVRTVWFWPTLLTLAAGLFRVTRPELWRDELSSWSAASRDLAGLWRLLGNVDAGYGLYYLFLHGWTRLAGDSVLSLRLPSVLAMAGAAAVVALLGQRLFGRRAGVVAGLLFAFIPAISRFAQETRPYAIAVFLAALSTLLLLRALDRPGAGRLAAYAGCLAVLGWTQVAAAAVIGAHLIGMIALWPAGRHRTLLRVAAAGLAGSVAVLPIVAIARMQYDTQVGAYPPATWDSLTLLAPRLFASTGVAIAVVALASLVWGTRWRPAVLLTAWALVPGLALWVVSQSEHSVWMTRYLLITLPAWALMAGAALAALRLPAAVVAVALVASLGVSDQRAVRLVGSHDSWDYPDVVWSLPLYYSWAAGVIAEQGEPGDGIVYANRQQYWMLDAGIDYHLPPERRPRDVFVDASADELGRFRASECQPLARCAPTAPRIWLVGFGTHGEDPYYDTEPEKAALLRAGYDVAAFWANGGVRLVLLARRPA